MPSIDIVVGSPISTSARARQLQSIFDVPESDYARQKYSGHMPLEEKPWSVGLILGPSGSGKSTILRDVFGSPADMAWTGAGVVDDFPPSLSVEKISQVCQAVGFNTIPAWLRPYAILSNGEKFRVELARRLIESDGITVIDEFTSVVDRQVAKIASHAAAKYIRKTGGQLVAASCHYDIVDWLQPDWLFEPAGMQFTWREPRRRPQIECRIERCAYRTWGLFAPYHYLSADLNRAAKCFSLKIDGRLAAFAAVLYRPHQTAIDIYGLSRVVTLPDFQGLGIAFVMMDAIGSLYSALGKRLHAYPAHPPFVRAMARSSQWNCVKKPGRYSPAAGKTSKVNMGGRPCAVFKYVGESMEDRELAHSLAE